MRFTGQMSNPTATRDRMPWAFVIGVGAVALGLIWGTQGNDVGYVVAIIGGVLIGAGLVQRTLARR